METSNNCDGDEFFGRFIKLDEEHKVLDGDKDEVLCKFCPNTGPSVFVLFGVMYDMFSLSSDKSEICMLSLVIGELFTELILEGDVGWSFVSEFSKFAMYLFINEFLDLIGDPLSEVISDIFKS